MGLARDSADLNNKLGLQCFNIKFSIHFGLLSNEVQSSFPIKTNSLSCMGGKESHRATHWPRTGSFSYTVSSCGRGRWTDYWRVNQRLLKNCTFLSLSYLA